MNIDEYLLTCLSEECIEIAKDISKALRFGLDDVNISKPEGPTNRQRIEDELNDFSAILLMVEEHNLINKSWHSFDKVEAKKLKILKYIEYARKIGALK